MIRHVVLLTWTAEATDEEKRRVAEEVGRLPSLVPAMRAFHIGPDAGLGKGNSDFAIVADFDDADGYRAYRDNAEHRDMIRQHILPVTSHRARSEYEF